MFLGGIMDKRIWKFVVLMLTLCMLVAACSSNNDNETTSVDDATPAVTEPESAPADITVDEPAEEVPEATPALASIDSPEESESDQPVDVDVSVDTETGIDVGIDISPEGIFARATTALQALDSYRFTTSFLFTGQEDGEVESGSIELSGEIMGDQGKHFVWKNLGDGEQFEIIQIDENAWIYDDEEWEEVPAMVANAMSQAVLIFAPSAVWDGPFGGLETDSTYVGPDTVDGIAAHHYTSTYQQWAGIWEGEVLDATGDVWIAEAGYPLRYDFTATAVDENGDQGTVTWSMMLTDAGADIVIEPPTIVEISR